MTRRAYSTGVIAEEGGGSDEDPPPNQPRRPSLRQSRFKSEADVTRRASKRISWSTVDWRSRERLDDSASDSDDGDDEDAHEVTRDNFANLDDVADDDDRAALPPARTWRGALGLALLLAATAAAGLFVGARFEAARTLRAGEDPQRLLEMAERVVLACDGGGGAPGEECADLCRGRLCCVAEGGCADGGGNDCAVYAGCKVLLEVDSEDADAWEVEVDSEGTAEACCV